MSKLKRQKVISVKAKLIRIQLLLAFLVLFPCSVALLLNDVLIFKRSVERTLESTAKMLGQNLAPAIAFGDTEEAKKILSSLQSEPSIQSALVFDSSGKVFANYGSESHLAPGISLSQSRQSSQLHGSNLIFFYRFGEGSETLYLSADLKSFADEYKGFAWIVVLVFLGGLLLSFGIAHWMQGPLTTPIVKLVNTAKAISRAEDYSLRMNGGETGIQEFETLSHEFNRMLEQIEARDHNIRHERDIAEKANKAKSIFLANMSHELRTPMHGILSYARFGQQKIETATKEKLKSYFDEIYESGARLMALLNDLLDLSKLEAGKVGYSKREGNFIQIVQTVQSEMSAFAQEKGLELKLQTNSDQIPGTFDHERIMQVIRNLLSNAIKFSTRGTSIEIVVERLADHLKCQVINQGVGIPEQELEAIFDKFIQSSKTASGAGGTGLGLAICREIVIHHNGKIWAENTSDGKTSFIFEIELSQSLMREAI